MISSFSGPYFFLSNFYPSTIVIPCDDPETKPMRFPSAEHLYQAQKAWHVKDVNAILNITSAGAAKRYWNTRQGGIRADWEQVKLKSMLMVLRRKFSDPDLAMHLLDTNDTILVEGNTWEDTFWGVCDQEGDNWLGRLLMMVRTELRIAEYEKS